MPNPVAHWEICVKDIKAGIGFYKSLFDWEIREEPEMNYAMVNTGEEPDGGIFQAQGEMKPYVTIYYKVEDIDAVIDKAEKLGAFVIARRTLISEQYGYYGLFADPDGNLVGLWSKK